MNLQFGVLLIPHVLGDGKVAILAILQHEVVLATDDPEESLLSPVRSPTVPDLPVLLPALPVDAVAGDRDDVIGSLGASGIHEDAAGVVQESVGNRDAAGDGAAVVDLPLHGLFRIVGTVSNSS